MPPWSAILSRDSERWRAARAKAAKGPKILIDNAFGIDSSVVNLNAMLALSLTLRGADVHLLACDNSLPACWVSQIERLDAEEFVEFGPARRVCTECYPGVDAVFRSLGLPFHRQSELISEDEVAEAAEISRNVPFEKIAGFRLDGTLVGEQALAGALRFVARGDLDGEPCGEAILRRYFNGALHTVFAARRLMRQTRFAAVVLSHGMYVPEGLIAEVARQEGARVVAWSFAYRKRTCVFSHDETYHHTLLSEPTATWENMPWSSEMERELLDYLYSRRYGTRDWIRFIEAPQEDIGVIARDLGVDFTKPSVGLLTNVVWDAQLTYRNNAFANMMEWIVETIRYFAGRPDLQLIIRVHPAELLAHTRARQTVTGEIMKVFPELPPNVFVIPPESIVSTYSVMDQCNAVILYGTKTGVELTSMGIPVIVAGEAWIRNKGVTLDVDSPAEYYRLLESLPLKRRMDEADVLRARKYAYHFFFRRMIPLPFTPDESLQPDVGSLEDLAAGRHPGLDIICRGILEGSEFVYPAEHNPAPADEETRVSKEGLAYGSFRVADGLGHMGEYERMRAQLLSAVREFSSALEEPWARPLIARNVLRLALAAENPAATVRDFWREAKPRESAAAKAMHGAVADGLRDAAIVLGKRGSYRSAVRAGLSSICHDPKQIFEASLMKRSLRALYQHVSTRVRERRGWSVGALVLWSL